MADHAPDTRVLEQGSICFAYRPAAEAAGLQAGDEVDRLYLVLKPDALKLFRMAAIGRQRLPEAGDRSSTWSFIEKISNSADEIEQALQRTTGPAETGDLQTLEPARAAGEGTYALVQAGPEMHLAYALAWPQEPGPLQRVLGIRPEGDFIIAVRNPEKGVPHSPGLPDDAQAHYPRQLQQEFGNRGFATCDPHLLDFEGAEFALIVAGEGPGPDIRRDATPASGWARELRMSARNPPEPLLRGIRR